MTYQPTDPRRPGGRIFGDAAPHTPGDVLVDTTGAVLVDYAQVVNVIFPGMDHGPVMGALLGGLISQTEERAEILYLLNGDGGANLVAQLLGLAYAIGPQFEAAFTARVRQLLAEDAPERRPYDG